MTQPPLTCHSTPSASLLSFRPPIRAHAFSFLRQADSQDTIRRPDDARHAYREQGSSRGEGGREDSETARFGRGACRRRARGTQGLSLEATPSQFAPGRARTMPFALCPSPSVHPPSRHFPRHVPPCLSRLPPRPLPPPSSSRPALPDACAHSSLCARPYTSDLALARHVQPEPHLWRSLRRRALVRCVSSSLILDRPPLNSPQTVWGDHAPDVRLLPPVSYRQGVEEARRGLALVREPTSAHSSHPFMPLPCFRRLLDAIHLALSAHFVYFYLVTNFDKPDALSHIVWSFKVRSFIPSASAVTETNTASYSH